MAQGFVIQNNLVESSPASADASAINNLAGEKTTNDFLLFDGNSKFISRLYRYEFNVINATDQNPSTLINDRYTVVVTAEGRTAFSNGTLIALGSESSYTHVVMNSNGVNTFQVRLSTDVLTKAPVDISGYDYLQRRDAISKDNVSFFSVSRFDTIDSTSVDDSTVASNTADLYNAYSISSILSFARNNLTLLPYKKTRVPLGYLPSTFDKPVKFSGVITITNDSEVTQGSTSPGIFMTSPSNASAAGVRAFSDSSQPWTEDGTAGNAAASIKTTKASTEVTNLDFNPGDVALNATQSATPEFAQGTTASLLSATDITRTIESFTHKMPMTINGEEYFLLMRST